MLKLKFDDKQEHQKKAIEAVINVFEGQPFNQMVGKEITNPLKFSLQQLSFVTNIGYIIPNPPIILPEEQILENINKVREYNQLPKLSLIEGYDELGKLNLTIEMETGTGKTYVYLRTILSLYEKYGFSKFIIIVPSVAIKSGVLKTLEITQKHFKELFQGINYDFYEYESKRMSIIRNFVTKDNPQILVMTMASFNKDKNLIYSPQESLGEEIPIDLIKEVKPILILDEPQNMEGEATSEALKSFDYLFAIRYSATHRREYNLLYRLSPSEAYKRGLVKKIEVYSLELEDYNLPYIKFVDIENTSKTIEAKLEVIKISKGKSLISTIIVKQGDNLFNKTGNNPIYRDNYIVSRISIEKIEFRNGQKVVFGNQIGYYNFNDEIIQKQIEETIIQHLEKKLKLCYNRPNNRIKVLSLFFIDRVDNYLKKDGKIRKIFEESFIRIVKNNPEYMKLYPNIDFSLSNEEIRQKMYDAITEKKDINVINNTNNGFYYGIHGGYFSKNTSEDRIEEDEKIYKLIMQDKESLLSPDNPLEFIFSHSALKEGWDNPNIFNICTLNETKSEIKRRQEIGRGLRLCVNEIGERILDENINILTVITNESYREYIMNLQRDYSEDYGEEEAKEIINTIEDAKMKKVIKPKQDILNSSTFQSLWNKIKHKACFFFADFDENRIINEVVKQLNTIDIPVPIIKTQKIRLEDLKEYKLIESGADISTLRKEENLSELLEKMIEYTSNETGLTKKAVIKILQKMENKYKILLNPMLFVQHLVNIILKEKINEQKNNIQYILLDDVFSEDIFKELLTTRVRTIKVNHSLYDEIVYESDVEKKFAEEIDAYDRVKLFIKLPRNYTIPTPIGEYNPDWAIIIEKGNSQQDRQKQDILYLIAETKFAETEYEREIGLRNKEILKIIFAQKLYSLEEFSLSNVIYEVVKNIKDIEALIFKTT
ncbi:MAG: DEAD/DEAH box helicase family protein [Thermovenabulum sp.]|uniref:restriction endonuclease n=1 Tax=Thermovenabulum sp. TaxID=3100335 RepID=UPI003C7BABBA